VTKYLASADLITQSARNDDESSVTVSVSVLGELSGYFPNANARTKSNKTGIGCLLYRDISVRRVIHVQSSVKCFGVLSTGVTALA